MSYKEKFINEILFQGRATPMQVKFLAEGALKNIADKDLGEFANFAFSLKTRYDNAIQTIINAANEYQRETTMRLLKRGCAFSDIASLKNFLVQYFKRKLVACGVAPFSCTSVSMNEYGEFINDNLKKAISAAEEVKFLTALLKEQYAIGEYRGELLAQNIEKFQRDKAEWFKEVPKIENNKKPITSENLIGLEEKVKARSVC